MSIRPPSRQQSHRSSTDSILGAEPRSPSGRPSNGDSGRGLGSLAVAVAVYAIQFGLAAWLFSLAPQASRPWTFYVYYGSLVVGIPAALEWASGGELSTTHRLWISVGLSLHPLFFFYGVYPGFWWADWVAHFYSGSLLAAAAYTGGIVLRERRPDRSSHLEGWGLHLFAFVVVLGGGLSWEVYELLETHLTVYGPFDTTKDVVVDVVAWVVVGLAYRRILGEIPEGIVRRVRSDRSGSDGSGSAVIGDAEPAD